MADMMRPPEPCDADFDIGQMMHHAEKVMNMGGPSRHGSPGGPGEWDSDERSSDEWGSG